jgi:hypothetical protein
MTSRSSMRTLLDRAGAFIHQTSGPLTDKLARAPGGFGLGQVPLRLLPDKTTTMVCGFCSTGCGLNVHIKDGVAVNTSPALDYPVNRGKACPKGWEALSVLASADRATMPLLKDAQGVQKPVEWSAALDAFVTRFRAIQTAHGPESVAFLGTGQMPTEELAFLGSLAKFGMGMIHGDGNTRQCMATSVVAYKEAFGFDAPPYTYADFELSDVLVFVGANPCIAHPILWQRVCRNPNSPDIVVLDPRRTETAEAATLHLPLCSRLEFQLSLIELQTAFLLIASKEAKHLVGMRRKIGQRFLYRPNQYRKFREILVMRPALLRLLPRVFDRIVIRGIRRQRMGGHSLAMDLKKLLGRLTGVIPSPIMNQKQVFAGLSHDHLQKRLVTLRVESPFDALIEQTTREILNGAIYLIAFALATGGNLRLPTPPRPGIT